MLASTGQVEVQDLAFVGYLAQLNSLTEALGFTAKSPASESQSNPFVYLDQGKYEIPLDELAAFLETAENRKHPLDRIVPTGKGTFLLVPAPSLDDNLVEVTPTNIEEVSPMQREFLPASVAPPSTRIYNPNVGGEDCTGGRRFIGALLSQLPVNVHRDIAHSFGFSANSFAAVVQGLVAEAGYAVPGAMQGGVPLGSGSHAGDAVNPVPGAQIAVGQVGAGATVGGSGAGPYQLNIVTVDPMQHDSAKSMRILRDAAEAALAPMLRNVDPTCYVVLAVKLRFEHIRALVSKFYKSTGKVNIHDSSERLSLKEQKEAKRMSALIDAITAQKGRGIRFVYIFSGVDNTTELVDLYEGGK